MELICDYMREDNLRQKLNALTRKTFGFDFENWVRNGYFEGDYIPYSFVDNGKVVSNVSANRMCFRQKGAVKEFIQIGTVMTDEAYRNQGLAGKLMEYVLEQYEGRCDGIYLFSDLGALGFYQKAGFTQGIQYQYRLKESLLQLLKEKEQPFLPADQNCRNKYIETLRQSAAFSPLEQLNKFGLQMFYTADLSKVYYAGDIDCFAVMEAEGDTLVLQSIVCRKRLSMKEILERIQGEFRQLLLGFTPWEEEAGMFETEAFDGGEDYRLFYRGKALESIEKEKQFFPLLSHA